MVLPEAADALADRVVVPFEQVMAPAALQLIVGGFVFACKVVLAVAVQPFPDWVTVTV